MVLRAIFLLALLVVCSATSCIEVSGFAVAHSAADSSTTQAAAFALQETVSREFGLAPYAHPDRRTIGFTACFSQDTASPGALLCGKAKDGEVQFLLVQRMLGSGATWHGDSLRLALFDSLRNRFGEHAVRECAWQQEDDDAQSGCRPATAEANR
jgi:hypothetical protein